MCFLGLVVLIGFIVTDFGVCVLLLGVARFVWICGFVIFCDVGLGWVFWILL